MILVISRKNALLILSSQLTVLHEEHFKPIELWSYARNFCKHRNLICIFSRHQNTCFITTKPYNFMDCVRKMASKESLKNLSGYDIR